jgi:transcriptional regulator with XRE-family HTH domain
VTSTQHQTSGERPAPSIPTLDASLHERRRAQRLRDPEYRAAYERARREIEQTDQVIRQLDTLRVELGISKAELARRIGRNASSIRRLFTTGTARPELPLVAAIADAVGAEVKVVPKDTPNQPSRQQPNRQRERAVA